jgi:hypothetical protein
MDTMDTMDTMDRRVGGRVGAWSQLSTPHADYSLACLLTRCG